MDAAVNQEAEGKKFSFLPVSEIKTEELIVFEFDSPEQLIEIETPEFSAVCPFSGLPDIAVLKISYHPTEKVALELKALKYYMTSFRNVGIYQEAVTARIYKDLKAILKTESLLVETKYNIRGGFSTTCKEGQLFQQGWQK